MYIYMCMCVCAFNHKKQSLTRSWLMVDVQKIKQWGKGEAKWYK